MEGLIKFKNTTKSGYIACQKVMGAQERIKTWAYTLESDSQQRYTEKVTSEQRPKRGEGIREPCGYLGKEHSW